MRPKFAVVREDPRLESALLRGAPGPVVTVASGGCSALALAKAFPAVPITAFDMSPVQIAHAQAKLALALAGNEHALGVANDDAAGHSQCGEFEGLFRVLRLFLQEFVAPAASFQTFFAASTTPEARALLLSQWQGSPYFNAAFELAFADSLLLGQQSDVAILATMRDVSRLPLVNSAVDRLRSVGVRVLGTVVNGVSDAAPRRLYTSPLPG